MHFKISGLALALAAGTSLGQIVEVPVAVDYTTGTFFTQGGDFVRGIDDAPARPTLRVSRSGFGNEWTFFNFDFDPSAFSGPIQSAVFSAESRSGGFGFDVGPTAAGDFSLHSLTLDPLSNILDDTNPTGPLTSAEFIADQITVNSVISTITIDSFGTVEWDVTNIVNEWIANGDSNFEYTLGASLILNQGPPLLAGFTNSSLTNVTSLITITVPAPGVLAVAGMGLVAARRRR